MKVQISSVYIILIIAGCAFKADDASGLSDPTCSTIRIARPVPIQYKDEISVLGAQFDEAFFCSGGDDTVESDAPPTDRAYEQPLFTEPKYQMFGGGTYLRSSGSNLYGWDASLSDYPFERKKWLGGMIEANGVYRTSDYAVLETTIRSNIYTVLAGPSFILLMGKPVEPFAHVLFGAATAKSSIIGQFASLIGNIPSSTAFAIAPGAGLDVPLSSTFVLREETDFLIFANSKGSSNSNVLLSGGLVVKF